VYHKRTNYYDVKYKLINVQLWVILNSTNYSTIYVTMKDRLCGNISHLAVKLKISVFTKYISVYNCVFKCIFSKTKIVLVNQ